MSAHSIVITKLTFKTWSARLAGSHEACFAVGTGNSPEEALGSLVMQAHSIFSIECVKVVHFDSVSSESNASPTMDAADIDPRLTEFDISRYMNANLRNEALLENVKAFAAERVDLIRRLRDV